MSRLSRFGALVAAAVGAVALLGWIFHVPRFTSVVPGLVTMKVNTACAFLAAGVALWSWHTTAPRSRSLARVLAAVVAALGALTLAQYVFGMDLGIDQIILRDVPAPADTLYRGRMSPATALNFLCIGLALLSLTARQSRALIPGAYWLAVVPLFVSTIAIVGYAYDVRSLYQVGRYASMAAPTALCFFVLSLSVLTANPARGIAKVVVSDTAGGVVARVLLPTLPVILFLLGWLRRAGENAGLYDTNFGLALNVVFGIAVCVVGVGITAFRLHTVDVKRKSAEAEILALNAKLERRVWERTQDLENTLERLSMATAVAKVGVWEWDLASNTLTWDSTMFEIYGFPPVAPMPYARWAAAVVVEDLPAVEATLQRAIAEKGQGSAEFRIVLPGGALRRVLAVERVMLDERANVRRVIGVNMDVTQRHEAAQVLEQSRQDQMQFKDDFLSHVSHELRSPLTAIKQFTTILLGGLAGELNKVQREYQEIVLKNIRQLQSMIDDLLEVTRLETGKLTVDPESVSVADAVTDTLNTLNGTARAKGVTLSSDLPPDLPRALADPTRLRQILIILLDNAIKFTPDGGAVTIEARRSPRDSQFLLLEVSDTGCGISPEVTERIFERLYQVSDLTQASRKGLGLGLYICKELVTRQGGEIRGARRPEQGSIFSFTLPVFPTTSGPPARFMAEEMTAT